MISDSRAAYFSKIMNDSEADKSSKSGLHFLADGYFILALISLGALVATFLVSNFAQSFQTKFLIFTVIILAYILFCVLFYSWQQQKTRQTEKEISDSIFNEEVEGKLLALEEASAFFGASLKFPDMFRLVASRINEIVPFAACVLFLVDEEKNKLKAVCAVGENSRNLLNAEMNAGKGLAGKTLLDEKIRREEKVLSDENVLPENALKNLESGLAVPLFSGGGVFGVLTLYGNNEIKFDETSMQLIEAVGMRAAPLFLSSMSFERSLTNALTDSLTNLPNERAFYLVLENQTAESQRNRDERPLTILAVDIKDFAKFNQKFGHATGDRMLTFAAHLIKAQLRQMDFLARSSNDEFLVVLPTAAEEITKEIIERIKKAFIYNKFDAAPGEQTDVRLNFGAATFWKNGETSQQLLQHARLQKEQTKSERSGKVILFPKEYAN